MAATIGYHNQTPRVRSQTVVTQYGKPGGRLGRCKHEIMPGFVVEQPLDRAIAEITITIKENERRNGAINHARIIFTPFEKARVMLVIKSAFPSVVRANRGLDQAS